MKRIFISAILVCCMAASNASTITDHLKVMTGHDSTKVVWVRSTTVSGMGYLNTPNPSCILMGFDALKGTEDTLCKTVSNYTRPLITSDGKHVVYSSTSDTTVNIIDWDGTHKRVLAKGMAGCLWVDTTNKKEYVICVKDCFFECKESIVRVNIYDTCDVATIITPTGAVSSIYQRIHPTLLSISSDGKLMCLDIVQSAGLKTQMIISTVTKKIMAGGPIASSAYWPSMPYDTLQRMMYFATSTHENIISLGLDDAKKTVPLDFCIPEEDCGVGHLKMAGYNPSLVAFVQGAQDIGAVVVAKFKDDYSSLVDTCTVSTTLNDGFPDIWTPVTFAVGSCDTCSCLQTHVSTAPSRVSVVQLKMPVFWDRSSYAILSLKSASDVSASIYTLQGRSVWSSGKHAFEAGEHHLLMNTSTLSPGRYVCLVKTGNITLSRPIIINNKQ
jgi:hypothetical protein